MKLLIPAILIGLVAGLLGALCGVGGGLVMVPAYVSRLGPEAFGLVSFFIVLQTLFQLLDLGLTPTMSREAARFRGGAIDGVELRQPGAVR